MDKIAGIDWHPHTNSGLIAKAAVEVAEAIGAKYLVAFTKTGDTALRLCRLRSEIQVCALSPNPRTSQTMTLAWGVKACTTSEFSTVDAMVDDVVATLKASLIEVDDQMVPMVQPGDDIVIVAGNPQHSPGKTNSLRVVRI